LVAKLTQLGLLLIWGGLLWAGGILLVNRAFHLPRRERLIAGLAAGLLVETLLAGWLSRNLGSGTAFWLAAGITLLLGMALYWPVHPSRLKELLPVRSDTGLLVTLAAMVGLFTLIGRGISPASDAQSLPLVSLLAAGEPLKLPGNAIFNELIAAQVMRLGGLYPWLALDLARAVSLSLTALLAGLWARRVTGSALAGWCAGLLGWLGGGTRWLVLLFPAGVLRWLGADAQLLRASGNWLGAAANRTGGLDLPFMLSSDLPPAQWISGLTGGVLLAGVVLLTASRWRGWRAGLVSALLLAGAGLSDPLSAGVLLAGVLVSGALTWKPLKASVRQRRNWLAWLGLSLAAGLVGLGLLNLQGAGWHWPPQVISGDWGAMSGFNPRHLFIFAIESGWLVLLAGPGLAWCWRAARAGRWYEASFLSLPVLGGLSLFLSGASWVVELQSALSAFAFSAIGISAAWLWARKRGGGARGWLTAAWLAAALSGAVGLGAALVAAPQPILASFIEPLDAQMMDANWDKLEPAARVFDPLAVRGETLFARGSGLDATAQQRLSADPNVEELLAAKVDYLYYGWSDWKSHEMAYHQIQELACARVVSETKAKRGEDFRVLIDLRDCR